MSNRVLALCLLALVTSTGCLEVDVKNKAPVTRVSLVSVNGTSYNELAMDPTMALPPRLPMGFPNPVAQLFVGAPATVVLQATATDPDGEVASYRWLRTDLPRAARFPDTVMPPPPAGMGAAGAPAGGAPAAGGAGGMGAAGMMAPPAMPPPPGAPAALGMVGDPEGKGPMVTIELPSIGSYRFTVWSTDDENFVSVPASLTIDVRPPPAAP